MPSSGWRKREPGEAPRAVGPAASLDVWDKDKRGTPDGGEPHGRGRAAGHRRAHGEPFTYGRSGQAHGFVGFETVDQAGGVNQRAACDGGIFEMQHFLRDG